MPTSRSATAFPKGSVFSNTGTSLHDDRYHEWPNGKSQDPNFKDTKNASFKDKLKAIVNPGSLDLPKDEAK